jgi:hypothetical protein
LNLSPQTVFDGRVDLWQVDLPGHEPCRSAEDTLDPVEAQRARRSGSARRRGHGRPGAITARSCDGAARVLRTTVPGERCEAWKLDTRMIDDFVVSVCAELG